MAQPDHGFSADLAEDVSQAEGGGPDQCEQGRGGIGGSGWSLQSRGGSRIKQPAWGGRAGGPAQGGTGGEGSGFHPRRSERAKISSPAGRDQDCPDHRFAYGRSPDPISFLLDPENVGPISDSQALQPGESDVGRAGEPGARPERRRFREGPRESRSVLDDWDFGEKVAVSTKNPAITSFVTFDKRNATSWDLEEMGERIDGKIVAAEVLAECAAEIAELKERGITPGLAVVLVGEDPASQVYVNSKVRKCADLGLHSEKIVLPKEATQDEVLAVVERLNGDSAIHGILVQSPPPPQIDEEAIVRAIDPAKDVDGFHPENVAKLALEDPSGFVPCTPAGCLRLIKASGVETKGAEAVVVGRSMIVGKPMALLLMARGSDATVTVAHSRTSDLAAVCRRADILVAAVGIPELIKEDFVKEGATVIDVGINRVDDARSRKGYRLCGDVAYDEVAGKAGSITPVPGGVGPMTIAMLMKNTIKAARMATEGKSSP